MNWAEFIRTHIAVLAGMNFFTVLVDDYEFAPETGADYAE